MKQRSVSSVWALSSIVLGAAVLGVFGGCGSSSGGSGFGGGDAAVDGGVDATTHRPGEGGTKSLSPEGSSSLGGHDAGQDSPSLVHGCDVSCVTAGGTCTKNVCVLRENPGNLTAAQEQALQAGGTADPSFKFVYPYDGTVFPRGLISPTLQFDAASADGFLVSITYGSLNYLGYFAGSTPARLQISDLMWTAITQGAAATDTVVVAVTEISGTNVTGPVKESWSVAQGSMRGQIYYETYGSAILGGPASVGIMSIAPGAAKPTPIASGCGNVCHTASADGSTLISATGFIGTGSQSYTLTSTPVAKLYTDSKQSFVYGGLYPDGSFAMSATHYRTWLGAESHLYNTKTGAQIPAPGWDGVFTYAGTNAFSPDGKHFAFNRNDLDQGAGHTLAIADFAASTKTFSNAENLTTDVDHTLAWPAFTPDDASVVYHAAIGGPVDGGVGSGYETDEGATGDVYRLDIATKTPVRLDALDGYLPSGETYLPENDPELSFAPTVLPEAVGGYYWVVFTSHRSYGNTLPSKDNDDENGKLWVAAIDQNPTPGKDSSHPAFYLDGQESVADNLRGFWVLPPCKQDGNACGSGDECCTGFCRPDGEGGAYSCVPAPAGQCANEYEKCAATSDCCQASEGFSCINGFCAEPPPK